MKIFDAVIAIVILSARELSGCRIGNPRNELLQSSL
jgi:predicted small secreted protein